MREIGNLLDPIFEEIASLLAERIAGVIPTTEDAVRYTFFVELESH